MKKSIYHQLLDAECIIENHEGDLYTPVTETSEVYIDAYEFKCNVEMFTSAIDGTKWFDIPFAFDPFYYGK